MSVAGLGVYGWKAIVVVDENFSVQESNTAAAKFTI